MQKYYWQILVDGKPWNMKIWNRASAEGVYKNVKSQLERHVDYKCEKIELVKLEGD